MGKSSVLQALLLLRQSYLDGLLPATGLELNGSLVQLGTAQDVLFEDAQSDDFEIGVTWRDGKEARFVLQYHRDADVLKINPESITQDPFGRIPFTDAFHYLRAERLGPRATNAVSDFQVREHRQMGTSGEFAEHYLHLYGTEIVKDGRLLHAGSQSSDLRSQVQAWLDEISPGAEVHLAMLPEMDIVNLRYSFITGNQRSNRYRSTSVGFGITYALPLLIAMLSSKPGSIVLLENPEAHLHPRGQVKIGELAARAAATGVQVIIETHSDHVLNGVRIAVHAGVIAPESISICYFSRMEDGGRVRSRIESPRVDKDGRLDRWPDGFFDEWEKSLECLLSPSPGTSVIF
jgi:predicted ATPase